MAKTVVLSRFWPVLMAFVLVGCSGSSGRDEPTGTVSGSVTYKGNPVASASIFFVNPEAGTGGGGTLDSEGKFAFSKPIPTGEYKVFLGPPEEQLMPDGQPKQGPAPKVPQKYLSEATTDVTVKVNEGDNQLPIELKD